MEDSRNKSNGNLKEFVDEIRGIIDQARNHAARSVDQARVLMYWNIGKRIFEKEQQGKERADYGSFLLDTLSKNLAPIYGSGFSVRQLEICRKFLSYLSNCEHTVFAIELVAIQLLIAIPDKDKREYYQLEAVNEGWSKRQLERQINSMLYERLLMSNDKEKVLAVARKERTPESPLEIIKDPMVLEFLGLEKKPAYYERTWRVRSSPISLISFLNWAKDFPLSQGRSDC